MTNFKTSNKKTSRPEHKGTTMSDFDSSKYWCDKCGASNEDCQCKNKMEAT